MSLEWPLAIPAEWRAGAAPVEMAGFAVYERGKTPPGVMGVEGEWAGVASIGEQAQAGPTGNPWVDSNGWKIRLLTVQNPGRMVWVESKEPAADRVIRVERYLVGMADAAAHGGRWVIQLDASLRKALAAKNDAALRQWARIRAAAEFFRARGAMAALPARAVLAVVSDFAGENETLSHEILNLAARQRLPYLIVEKGKLTALPAGLKAVIYPDAQAPAAAVRSMLAGFVQSGGLLITGAAWGKMDGAPVAESPSVRFTMHAVGAGRIAMAKEGGMDDPYLVAADAQVLLSHRHDALRIWNGGSMGAYLTGDSQRAVAHLINYSGRPGADPVSVWIAGEYRKVMLRSFEFAERELPLIRQRNGVEVHLPAIATYAALEASV